MCGDTYTDGPCCEAHTRPAAIAVLNRVAESGASNVRKCQLDMLVNYAALPGGRIDLVSRYGKAMKARNMELVSIIGTAIQMGDAFRAAHIKTVERVLVAA